MTTYTREAVTREATLKANGKPDDVRFVSPEDIDVGAMLDDRARPVCVTMEASSEPLEHRYWLTVEQARQLVEDLTYTANNVEEWQSLSPRATTETHGHGAGSSRTGTIPGEALMDIVEEIRESMKYVPLTDGEREAFRETAASSDPVIREIGRIFLAADVPLLEEQ